jgi:hypothetical protein
VPRSLRRRYWIELSLSSVCAVAALLTILIPNWLEVVFGVDPDEHGGAVEVVMTVWLFLATAAFIRAARLERRATNQSGLEPAKGWRR